MSKLKWAILSREARAADREQAVSGFVFVIAFPVIIGVGGAYTGAMTELHAAIPLAFWVVVLGFYILFWWRARPNTRSILGLLRDEERLSLALSRSEQDVSQLTQSVELLVWQSTVSLSTRRMMVEYTASGISKRSELEECFSEILAPIHENVEDLFGAGGSEKWNFGAYLYSKKLDRLIPVWRARAATHPAVGLGREWQRGEGHVGKAFVNEEPIITHDASHPDVAPLSATPKLKQQPYDETVYRSFAAFPIGPLSPNGNPCLGVLVSTSDRVGRFDRENTDIIRHLADVLAGVTILSHIDVDSLT